MEVSVNIVAFLLVVSIITTLSQWSGITPTTDLSLWFFHWLLKAATKECVFPSYSQLHLLRCQQTGNSPRANYPRVAALTHWPRSETAILGPCLHENFHEQTKWSWHVCWMTANSAKFRKDRNIKHPKSRRHCKSLKKAWTAVFSGTNCEP